MSSTPAWNDPDSKAGTMVRGALWLVQKVGEGNTFTKHDVRTAFPGVSQADRRIRDLRAYGWVIDSNTHDASLQPEEQRLVKIGAAVWDSQERRAAAPETVTAKERLQAFKRDNFMCTVCGISGGDPYPEDENKIAVLALSRRIVQDSNGTTHTVLVTECSLCRNGGTSESVDIGRFLAATDDLEPQDLRRLERWILRGRRGSTPLERAWTAYRLLTEEARTQAQSALTNRSTT